MIPTTYPSPLALQEELFLSEVDDHRLEKCPAYRVCLAYACAYNWKSWSCAWCRARRLVEMQIPAAEAKMGLSEWIKTDVPVLCAASKKVVAGQEVVRQAEGMIRVAVVGALECRQCQPNLWGVPRVWRHGCDYEHKWYADGENLRVTEPTSPNGIVVEV